MSRGKAFRAILCLSTVLAGGIAAPAIAKSAHPNVDANGVDLTDGSFNLRLPIASIGSGSGALELTAYDSNIDNFTELYAYQSVGGGGKFLSVVLGNSFDNFSSADGFAKSTRGSGATITVNGDNSVTYRTLDGVEILFGNPVSEQGGASNICDSNNDGTCFRLALSVTQPSELTLAYNWDLLPSCTTQQVPDEWPSCTYSWRLKEVSNEAGYSVAFTFANNGIWPNNNSGPSWFQRTSAQLKNANASAASWPTVTYGNPSTGVYTFTTPGGRTWRITKSGNLVTGIRRPSATSDTTTITYSGSTVTSVTSDGVTTNYAAPSRA
ncbi:MAG: hypothetical protein ACREUQ_04560 [Burkholderiales bacterium]